MSSGLSTPISDLVAQRDHARLRVQERLCRCLHHELRGSLNGAGLQLSLLGRLARGELDDRPQIKARSGEWVASARQELAAIQSWADGLLALLATSDTSEASDAPATDLVVLLTDIGPWLSALGRRQGITVAMDLPSRPVSVPEKVVDLRLALLDLTTLWIGSAEPAESPPPEAPYRLRVELSTAARLELSPWRCPAKPSAFVRGVVARSGGNVLDEADTLSVQWPIVEGV